MNGVLLWSQARSAGYAQERGIIDRVKRVRFGVAAIVGDFRSDRNSFFRLLIFVSAYERIYVKVENRLMQGPYEVPVAI